MTEPALAIEPPRRGLPVPAGATLPEISGGEAAREVQAASLDGFLLSAFRRFHQELVDSVGVLARAADPTDDRRPTPSEISQRLGAMIQRLGLAMPTFAGAFGGRCARRNT